MEIVFRPLCSRQRPVGLVAPGVGAHDKHPDRGLIIYPVGHTFQPAVEPAARGPLEVDLGGFAEVENPHLGDRVDGVGPGSDQQFLALASEPAHGREVPECPRLVVVVPPGNMEDGEIDPVVMPFEIDEFPVIIVGRMREITFPEREMGRPAASSSSVASGSLRMAHRAPEPFDLLAARSGPMAQSEES